MIKTPPKYVWMDGRFVEWENAAVHVSVHALHYGTAVFEGIRAYMGKKNLYVFRLPEHLNRLMSSAKMLGLSSPYSVEELRDAVIELLRKNEFKTDLYIRPLLYVGRGSIGLDISKNEVNVLIFAFPFPRYFEKPRGLKVCVSSWRRIDDDSSPPMAKVSGNYVNSVLATMEARRAGYDEAIFLNQKGYVSEGPGENIFLVRNGSLATPPLCASILEGITRNTVMELAREEGFKVEERMISRGELYLADELFFTGSAAEITPIIEVDGRPVGDGKPGEITLRIRERFIKIVRGEDESHIEWLTPIY